MSRAMRLVWIATVLGIIPAPTRAQDAAAQLARDAAQRFAEVDYEGALLLLGKALETEGASRESLVQICAWSTARPESIRPSP